MSTDYKALATVGDKVKIAHTGLNDFYLVIKELVNSNSIQILLPKDNISACCNYKGDKRAYCVGRHRIKEVKGHFSERL